MKLVKDQTGLEIVAATRPAVFGGVVLAIAPAATGAYAKGIAGTCIAIALAEDVALMSELLSDLMDPSQVSQINGG
jgi:hypothetical protein